MALTRITTGIIADNTLAVANIADNAVDATKIASNSILTRHIDDDQITGDQLADNITIAGTLTSTGAITGTLATAAQTNITSLGTLTALTVQKASSGASATSNTVATIEDDDNTELSILGGSSSVLGINFGHSGDNDEGRITFNTTAGSEDLQIVSSKEITLDAGGDIIFDADGGDWYFKDGGTQKAAFNQYGLGIGSASSAGYIIEGEGTGHQRINLRSSDNNTAGIYLQVKNSGNMTGNATLRTDSSGNFSIWTGTTSESQKVTVEAGGDVGIGTTDPASHYGFGRTLEVQGSANAEINISQTDNSKNWSLGIVNGSNYQQTDNNNYIWESGGVERMRIDASGNVGIGVAPSYAKMHIIGGSSGSGDFDALAIHHENTTTTGDGPVIRFEGEYSNAVWALAEMKATNGGAGFGANFQINTHPGGGTQGSNVLPAFFLKRVASNIMQAGFHAGGATTYADDASTTLSGVCNTSALIFIQSQRKAGGNSVAYDAALFFAHYGIDSGASVVTLADPGGTFSGADTDGRVCVYKGNNTANVTVKNRLGYDTGISVVVMPMLGN